MSLSQPPADARAFSPAAAEGSWQGVSVSRLAAATALFVILALAAVDAALRGPWLDEFWTLELSDTRNGLLALIRDGWMRDAHPPVFNAWATLLASLGVDSIPAGRLTSNLLAAGLMIMAARRFSRRVPEQAGFNTVLLLLVLSLPQAMDAFAIYRAYFWHIAAVGTLVLVARHVASTRADLDWRRDADLVAIAVVAAAMSMGLHYVGGLFGGLLCGAIALSAYRRGLRRWAILMFATASLASLFIVASVLLQAPNWAAEFDHSWIDLPAVDALGVPVALAVTALCHNPIPLVGFWIAGTRPSESQLHFVAMIGSVLVVGVVIVLAVHAFKPIVVDRYLFAVPVLICALMAVPAARFAQDSLLFGLLALVSVAVAAAPLVQEGIKPLWRQDAETIAKIVSECPTTTIYAASGWALGPAAETRTARREDPVFARAYRLLADGHGYAVRFIGQNGTAHATPGACPVLLWYEHTPNNAEDDLAAAVEEAGLTGLESARLSAVRSATGFVVRADRP
jgi:branched-subunit amino acid transport protein AzlD